MLEHKPAWVQVQLASSGSHISTFQREVVRSREVQLGCFFFIPSIHSVRAQLALQVPEGADDQQYQQMPDDE